MRHERSLPASFLSIHLYPAQPSPMPPISYASMFVQLFSNLPLLPTRSISSILYSHHIHLQAPVVIYRLFPHRRYLPKFALFGVTEEAPWPWVPIRRADPNSPIEAAPRNERPWIGGVENFHNMSLVEKAGGSSRNPSPVFGAGSFVLVSFTLDSSPRTHRLFLGDPKHTAGQPLATVVGVGVRSHSSLLHHACI